MGRTYTGAEQLERVYTAMFDAVADDDSMDTLVDAQMVINFRLHIPTPTSGSTAARVRS